MGNDGSEELGPLRSEGAAEAISPGGILFKFGGGLINTVKKIVEDLEDYFGGQAQCAQPPDGGQIAEP